MLNDQLPPALDPSARSAREPALEPLLVDARQAAALLSISAATFWRWDSSGTLGPRGFKRGGKRLWPLAELKSWIERGMVARPEWQALQESKNGRK